MKTYNLYYLDDSERSVWEAQSKGYRNDVYVEIQNELFHVHIYDNIRLIQDFEDEMKQYGYYQIEPNLILVQTVIEEEIIKTLDNLVKQDYFARLKPIRSDEIVIDHLRKISR